MNNKAVKEEKVPCKVCGTLTDMVGTKHCNNCWEISRRCATMTADQIEKILRDLGFQARVMGKAD